MPPIHSPDDNIISARLPSWPVIVGIPAVLAAFMLLLHLSDANMTLFWWLNGFSRYTGEPLWANITLLGEGLLAVALLAPIARWRRDIAWSLFLSAIIAIAVVFGLKELFAVPRPALVLAAADINIIGPRLSVVSFPSGHTATITIFATILALHLNRGYLYAIAMLAILLVGLSRVVVGAHWPMDVLGGMLLGWCLALAGIRVAQHLSFGVERNWQTAVCVLSLTAAALFWGAETGQHLAVLLQRSAAVAAGVLGLLTLAKLWWPTKNRDL
ncbi:MAG: phosphatase PAP2 family protein [Acidiferrobacterales bacterium]